MWSFKRKKIYKVTWSYYGDPKFGICNEIVKAKDAAHAWKKVRRQHNFAISCVEIKEVM